MEFDWITTLNSVAFPIFMCLWFMFRMEKVIQNNTDALNKLLEKLS